MFYPRETCTCNTDCETADFRERSSRDAAKCGDGRPPDRIWSGVRSKDQFKLENFGIRRQGGRIRAIRPLQILAGDAELSHDRV
jgi:hypothetical protein